MPLRDKGLTGGHENMKTLVRRNDITRTSLRRQKMEIAVAFNFRKIVEKQETGRDFRGKKCEEETIKI